MNLAEQDRERLWQFFGAYFHQDWALDDSNWQGVVLGFLKDRSPESARDVLHSIRAWLQCPASDADVAKDLYESFGCHYLPQPDGLSNRAWVEQVAEFIARHVGM
jgi:hypothetical protein